MNYPEIEAILRKIAYGPSRISDFLIEIPLPQHNFIPIADQVRTERDHEDLARVDLHGHPPQMRIETGGDGHRDEGGVPPLDREED